MLSHLPTLIFDAVSGRQIAARRIRGGVGGASNRADHEVSIARIAGQHRGALKLGQVKAGGACHGRVGGTSDL